MARVYSGLDVRSDFGGTFPWKSATADVGGGVRQAYVDEGPRDAPLTFLLLHGNPTWSYLYRSFIGRLAARHRVLAVDHVGFGRSDKPRDPAYYTLERHIDNLERTSQAAGVKRAVPVMQDWGGPIGTGWATRHPELVAGMVVLNTWAFVRDPPMVLPPLFRFPVLGKGGWKRATRSNIFVELFIARFPQLIPPTSQPDHESWKTTAAIEDALPKLRSRQALVCWALKDPAFKKPTLRRWVKAFDRVDGPHLLEAAGHYLQEGAPGPILDHLERWAAGVHPA